MILTEKQKLAVQAKESNVLVIAPAGSGKTTVLVEAIKEYKKEKTDAVINAITFTRKATDDLKTKLSDYKNISVSTIHSWSYTELIKLSEKVTAKNPNNYFKIKLLDDDKIQEILGEIAKKQGYYYVKIPILFFYVMGNYNMDLTDSMKKVFEAIRTRYITHKEKNGLYDFTDLPKYLLDKLNDYDEYVTGIDGLFVDEFQDVDDIQLEIFNRTKTEKKFYIGDPSQSIYQFRGATSDVLDRLKNFKKYELDVNFRSNQEIIDFATTFQNASNYTFENFSTLLFSSPSNIKCVKGEGGMVYSLGYYSQASRINTEQTVSDREIIKIFMEKNPVILCRKNKEVKEIQKLLPKANAMTIHQAKGLEFETVIVTDFEIKSEEDINIAYVAMTRAEVNLLVANYDRFIKTLKLIAHTIKLTPPLKNLF